MIWLARLHAELVPGELRDQRGHVDPDDDKYLAAALDGRASLVVTGDPDLLALKQYEGVRIVNPRALLGLLGG
jgi:predicted nucleic acid-binding protein